jgi:hypothetical protein
VLLLIALLLQSPVRLEISPPKTVFVLGETIPVRLSFGQMACGSTTNLIHAESMGRLPGSIPRWAIASHHRSSNVQQDSSPAPGCAAD